jgi:DNA-directed RNA polymerase sigma subunit (sigma70/sigma32)
MAAEVQFDDYADLAAAEAAEFEREENVEARSHIGRLSLAEDISETAPNKSVIDEHEAETEVEVDQGDIDKITEKTPSYLLADNAEGLDTLKLYLQNIGKVRLLTDKEVVDLSMRKERGDLEAKDRLVEANLRLVVSISKNTWAGV